jgi:hypothetical protein
MKAVSKADRRHPAQPRIGHRVQSISAAFAKSTSSMTTKLLTVADQPPGTHQLDDGLPSRGADQRYHFIVRRRLPDQDVALAPICTCIGAQTCRNPSLPRGFAWAEKGVARVKKLRGCTRTVKYKLAPLEIERLKSGQYSRSALAASGGLRSNTLGGRGSKTCLDIAIAVR